MFNQVFFTDRKKVFNCEKVIRNLSRSSTVIIREYDLPKSQREDFAKKIGDLARNQGLKFLVGKDLNLAKKVKADGVHFSDFDQLPLSLFRKRNFLLSFSCHSEKSLIKARKIKADMIFISPIFPTSTHENIKPIGIFNLAKIVKRNRNLIPIYALGGINSYNIKLLKKLEIKGFGAINFFLENK